MRSAPDEVEVRAERALTRDVLASSRDGDVQKIVNLLHSICDVDIAAVTVPDNGQFHYLVTAGIDPLASDAADTMCQHTMRTDQLVVVPDTAEDPRFAASPFADGRLMAVRFYASAPLRAPSGTIVGRLCVFDTSPRELTSLQEQALLTLADSVSAILDQRLRKLDAPAVAARRAHDEVVSVASQVSHDLRVPLTALTTSLGMLEESTPPDESPLRRSLLANALRSTARMTSLVDGLLRLNDVQRGLDLVQVDLGDAARQVVLDLEGLITETSATVSVGAMPTVRCDEGLIAAALLNLVSNAAKFARPGVAPVIEIAARRTAFGVRVIVRDNGIGIPPDDRHRVFALFSRLTPTPGHGIGLTTVARVAEAHGGVVGIDDGPAGVGSEIWFELPA